jgi:hypothetical protein
MSEQVDEKPAPKKSKIPARGPWTPAEYTIADAYAVKAVYNGNATAEQQQRAMKWIIVMCAGAYDLAFWPGGEDGRRNTDFSSGKQFVGKQLLKLIEMNPRLLRRDNG